MLNGKITYEHSLAIYIYEKLYTNQGQRWNNKKHNEMLN